jgi:hypothetical protein
MSMSVESVWDRRHAQARYAQLGQQTLRRCRSRTVKSTRAMLITVEAAGSFNLVQPVIAKIAR